LACFAKCSCRGARSQGLNYTHSRSHLCQEVLLEYCPTPRGLDRNRISRVRSPYKKRQQLDEVTLTTLSKAPFSRRNSFRKKLTVLGNACKHPSRLRNSFDTTVRSFGSPGLGTPKKTSYRLRPQTLPIGSESQTLHHLTGDTIARQRPLLPSLIQKGVPLVGGVKRNESCYLIG
jgi:hypothetical protein